MACPGCPVNLILGCGQSYIGDGGFLYAEMIEGGPGAAEVKTSG